jgi:hypothetical protein
MIGEPAQPLLEVQLPPLRPGVADVLRSVLQAHGGGVEEEALGCVFRFPDGTTKQRLFPQVQTTRYTICFPDGYQLFHTVERNGSCNLWFDQHDLPADVQRLLRV